MPRLEIFLHTYTHTHTYTLNTKIMKKTTIEMDNTKYIVVGYEFVGFLSIRNVQAFDWLSCLSFMFKWIKCSNKIKQEEKEMSENRPMIGYWTVLFVGMSYVLFFYLLCLKTKRRKEVPLFVSYPDHVLQFKRMFWFW